MQRTSGASRLAFVVERGGDGKRVWIDFDDRVEPWPLPVDGLDARQVFFGDRPRGEPARLHHFLQIADRFLVQLERAAVGILNGRARGTAAGSSRGAAQHADLQKASTIHKFVVDKELRWECGIGIHAYEILHVLDRAQSRFTARKTPHCSRTHLGVEESAIQRNAVRADVSVNRKISNNDVTQRYVSRESCPQLSYNRFVGM